MQRKTIEKILGDENNLDLFKTAEAILEDEKRKLKHNHISNPAKSNAAWIKYKARLQTEEAFRQRLAKAWKKSHPAS